MADPRVIGSRREVIGGEEVHGHIAEVMLEGGEVVPAADAIAVIQGGGKYLVPAPPDATPEARPTGRAKALKVEACETCGADVLVMP